MREDLERLKKIRSHRGLRHFWGLKVKGREYRFSRFRPLSGGSWRWKRLVFWDQGREKEGRKERKLLSFDVRREHSFPADLSFPFLSHLRFVYSPQSTPRPVSPSYPSSSSLPLLELQLITLLPSSSFPSRSTTKPGSFPLPHLLFLLSPLLSIYLLLSFFSLRSESPPRSKTDQNTFVSLVFFPECGRDRNPNHRFSTAVYAHGFSFFFFACCFLLTFRGETS